MVRRLIVGVVVAIGVFSIAIGVQRWLDARAAKSVVHSLMAALDAGDREAALVLLSPDRRKQVELRQADDDPQAVWTRQRDGSWQIEGVEIAGDHAVARVKIEKEGFALLPVISLRRGEAARWKIDRIENLEVDPRYLELQRAHARQQGEQLADRLHEALSGCRGVTVERVTHSEFPAADRR